MIQNNILIKKAVRVGNSAGVILPKEWYGGEIKVELIAPPLDLNKLILNSVQNSLEDIMGIYLVGSYARGEQTRDSDVDVIVITRTSNKKIKEGKLDILFISLDEVYASLKSVIPLMPMLLEAKTILNSSLLDELLRRIKLKNLNLKWHFETTKSALAISKSLIDLSDKVSSKVVYSLVLRIRELYLVECLIKNKKYLNKDFIKFLKENGVEKLYDSYLSEKSGKKSKFVESEDALVAYNLASKILTDQNETKKVR